MLPPETMLKLMGALDDPEARRHKFIGGLLAGTHSGSSAESFSNAFNALGDYEMMQMRLRMEYLPLMQRQWMEYNQQQRAWTKDLSMLHSQWTTGMNSVLSSLGPDATPQQIDHVLRARGNLEGMDPRFVVNYIQQIHNRMDLGEAPGDIAKQVMLEQLPPGERAERLDPTRKPQAMGGFTIYAPQTGAWLTPEQVRSPAGPIAHMPMLTEPHIEKGVDGSFYVASGAAGEAFLAGSPKAMALMQRYPQLVQQYTAAIQSLLQQPGGAPQLPVANPMPTKPITAPLPGAPPPTAPPLPPTAGGAPGVRISPGGSAAPGAVPGAAPGGLPGVPGGGVAAAQQPPGLTIYSGGRTYDGVPPSPYVGIMAGVGVGGMDPVGKLQAEETLKQFGTETTNLAKQVQNMQSVAQRADQIRQIILHAPTGATATARLDLAKWVKDIADKFIPNVRPEEATAWGNKIAGGDMTALQEFQKLALSGAMVDLRADQGTGQRTTQMEFQTYLNAVANPSLDPVTIAKLQQGAQMQRHAAQEELAARSAFLREGYKKVDLGGFNNWWQDYATRNKIVPAPAVTTGMEGKGTQYFFYKGADGTRMAYSPSIVYPPGHANAGKPMPLRVNNQLLGTFHAETTGQP
jgi:hypothetical protein